MVSNIWNPDVANAVAHHLPMPGVENFQSQFVRYQGQTCAKHTPQGWTKAESDAAAQQAQGAFPDPFEEPDLFVAPEWMPRQVQLSVSTAPADFCMPMKKQKRFKPGFKVEVRVVHSGHVHLPIRVKAFLVTSEQMNALDEWLPEELQTNDGSPEARAADGTESKLAGGRVLSCLFSNAAQASNPGQQGGPFSLGNPGQRGPLFPVRAPSSLETSVEPTVKLASDASLVSEATDPTDSASMLHVVSGTILAEFDFERAKLKFAGPTGMKPVYIAFASLVANRDLLYTVYTVPCIAVCRAEQREAARQRLGLPASVWSDLGVSRPAVIERPNKAGNGAAARAVEPAREARDDAADGPSMHDMWVSVTHNLVTLPNGQVHSAPQVQATATAPFGATPPPDAAQLPRPTTQPSLSEPPNLQAPNLLISSSTLDAMLRSGSASANASAGHRNSSLEGFWTFLQQQEDPSASLEELLQWPGAASGGACAPPKTVNHGAAPMRCAQAARHPGAMAPAPPVPSPAAYSAALELRVPMQTQHAVLVGPGERQRSRETPSLDLARLQ